MENKSLFLIYQNIPFCWLPSALMRWMVECRDSSRGGTAARQKQKLLRKVAISSQVCRVEYEIYWSYQIVRHASWQQTETSHNLNCITIISSTFYSHTPTSPTFWIRMYESIQSMHTESESNDSLFGCVPPLEVQQTACTVLIDMYLQLFLRNLIENIERVIVLLKFRFCNRYDVHG